MEYELHYIQMQILKELIFNPKAKFSELNKSDIPNDHFSYHLNKLVELDLVSKINGQYSLTVNGKKYAGKMDTNNYKIEKQPKSGVLIIPIRKIKQKTEYLVQQRKKEPYFGYWGFMTGKLRFGEKLYETADRELKEEMGVFGEYKLQFILHEMVYDKIGTQLEDKLFYIVEVREIKGDLLTKTPDGENKWVTKQEFDELSPKYHNEDDIINWYINGDKGFKEEKYVVDGF